MRSFNVKNGNANGIIGDVMLSENRHGPGAHLEKDVCRTNGLDVVAANQPAVEIAQILGRHRFSAGN